MNCDAFSKVGPGLKQMENPLPDWAAVSITVYAQNSVLSPMTRKKSLEQLKNLTRFLLGPLFHASGRSPNIKPGTRGRIYHNSNSLAWGRRV